jgi:hypothetical protein
VEERKETIERPRRRWEDEIRKDLRETGGGGGGGGWIHLAQNILGAGACE